MRTFTTTDELRAAVGEDLGSSDWLTMTQDRVNTMADAIDDHQWIHVDEERAKDGPYGGTIAHGYLTLALVPTLAGQVFDFSAWGTLINYGLEKVRFPNPVRVGDRVRARVRLADVADKAGGILVTLNLTMEIEGQERPGCISQALILLLD